MLNILFVMYENFKSNSAIHAHHFANALAARGHACAIAVPQGKDTAQALIGGEIRYKALEYWEVTASAPLFAAGRGPDIVHAWTPRERVRKLCALLKQRFPACKVIVHLEDNEEVIVENHLKKPFQTLAAYSPEQLNPMIPDGYTHPHQFHRFLDSADGVTIIIDTLKAFVPAEKPHMVLWPIIDPNCFAITPDKSAFRERLGIGANDFIVAYTGNGHASNAHEMRSLYLAVALANRAGLPTKLVRTGLDYCNFWGAEEAWARRYSIELGFVPWREVQTVLANADLLIQPGTANRFNDYRLPSKIPEFLAMGKPVAVPATNIGRYLQDGKNALLLKKGDALEIVQVIQRMHANPRLAKKLGKGALQFAAEHFSPLTCAANLEAFYARIANRSQKSARSKPAPIPAFGYATVGDYCDSAEFMPELCLENGDLKNVQRPWMVKALRALFPAGGKILEIGAGEPLVASILAQSGFSVTVVDPYDGSGNGPKDYEHYCRHYPAVKMIRDYFGAAIKEIAGQSFDCIYSISVLEHLHDAQLKMAYQGIAAFLKPGGYSVHCVDFVKRGAGAEAHKRNLTSVLARQSELARPNPKKPAIKSAAIFASLMTALENDLETYRLSAEGHNLWRRGLGMTYGQFPFREVVSINVCQQYSNHGKK